MWTGALRSAIARHSPDPPPPTLIDPHLSNGFPWHSPDVLHHHLSADPEAWWRELEALFVNVLGKLGYTRAQADVMAACVRSEYLDLRQWQLATGASDVLQALTAAGWRHAIVSNHVPELRDVVAGLGILHYFDHIFCSAHIGVEKPNALFFRTVLEALGACEESWVIGDNPRADIAGGKAAGLRTILVGSSAADADACAADLSKIPALLT